jgi:uncharacterized protein (DUF2147 family)
VIDPMNRAAAILAAVLLTSSCVVDTANAQRSALDGIWVTDDGDGAVEIVECGDSLCGTVYSILLRSNPPPPQFDIGNVKPELRSRPICGMPIFGGMKKFGPDYWGEGWIYDPHEGETYDAELTLQSPNVLSVHGYIHIKIVGRTVLWTRAEGRLSKCVPPK